MNCFSHQGTVSGTNIRQRNANFRTREAAVLDVVQIIQEDHFYHPAHRKIYHAIVKDLYDKGLPADLVTVRDAAVADIVGAHAREKVSQDAC